MNTVAIILFLFVLLLLLFISGSFKRITENKKESVMLSQPSAEEKPIPQSEHTMARFADCIERELGYIEEELTIINTTTNREELELSLNKISSMLEGLKTFNYMPERLLPVYETFQKIPENREQLIESFNQRMERNTKLQTSENAPQSSEPETLYADEDFDAMEGHDFEHFCVKLLQKNGFYNIQITPDSKDQGTDILAYKESVKYGIQCKCHSSNIGNKAIQEAFTGAKFYDCHVPVVLTNRYFTKSAIELSQKTNVLLWDRNKLLTMKNLAENKC